MSYIIFNTSIGKRFATAEEAHAYVDEHNFGGYDVYEVSDNPTPKPEPCDYQVIFIVPTHGPRLARNKDLKDYWMTHQDAKCAVQSYKWLGVHAYIVKPEVEG